MLIEFTVANFRSFKDRQSLSLVASSGSEHREQNVSTTGVAGLDLLRTAALYGPNAAGKSNLFHALRTLLERRAAEGFPINGATLRAALSLTHLRLKWERERAAPLRGSSLAGGAADCRIGCQNPLQGA